MERDGEREMRYEFRSVINNQIRPKDIFNIISDAPVSPHAGLCGGAGT